VAGSPYRRQRGGIDEREEGGVGVGGRESMGDGGGGVDE